MIFKNITIKILYYFITASFLAISILIFSLLLYLESLIPVEIFLILFFGFFFLQVCAGFLLVLMYFKIVLLKKNRRISGDSIVLIMIFMSFTLFPIELGAIGIFRNGGESLKNGSFLILGGGSVFFGFIVAYYMFKQQQYTPTLSELEILEKHREILKCEITASNFFDSKNYIEALKWYNRELDILLELGLSESVAALNTKKKIEELKHILNNPK